jgi:hypothetical protein
VKRIPNSTVTRAIGFSHEQLSRDNGGVNFHRPALFEGHEFAAFKGGDDPATISALAHETAAMMLAHVQDAPAHIVDKVVKLTDEHGLDVVADLWSTTGPHSLPGSLWQLYLLRAVIHDRADEIAHLYQRGNEALHTADHVIAGAPTPAGPTEMRELVDQILRGAFTGDFGHALERSGSFCRVVAAGSVAEANVADLIATGRAKQLTTQSSRLMTMATQFADCARLWRAGKLS